MKQKKNTLINVKTALTKLKTKINNKINAPISFWFDIYLTL